MGDDTSRISPSLCEHEWAYYEMDQTGRVACLTTEAKATRRYCDHCKIWQQKEWHRFTPYEGQHGISKDPKFRHHSASCDCGSCQFVQFERSQDDFYKFQHVLGRARMADPELP